MMKKMPLVMGVMVGALTSGSAFAQHVEGTSSGGQTTVFHPHSGVQLLSSFWFNYSSADHELHVVELAPDTPNQNQMRVAYADNNADDDYFYLFDHYDAPSTGIFASAIGNRSCKGICTVPIFRPAGDNVFVLRGFRVEFANAEHHLDQISIRENNGNVTVAFNDQNDDDTFSWDLYYAYVPRSRFSNLGTASGTASGGATAFIPNGNQVIRGFNLDFRSADHHIDQLGIISRGTGLIEIGYNDQRSDDSFDWALDWGVMN